MTQDVHVKLNPALPAFNKKALCTCKLDLNLGEKVVNCYTWNIAVCGAVTWTLRKVDQKYPGSFEMWCWRRMEKIGWTNRVRNEEVLHKVKEGGNYPTYNKRRKVNWIGHILCRNCRLEQVIEGKVQGLIE